MYIKKSLSECLYLLIFGQQIINWVRKLKIEKVIPFEFLEDNDLGTELLNVRSIKKYIKQKFNMQIEDTGLLILNDEIKEKLDKAFARSIANGRKKIIGQDI